MIRALLILLLAVTTAPVTAQTVVVSESAEDVSLTVYRSPSRGDRPINKNWPSGYALITETRTVTIPAGESVIRFEGVSEGMFPESAIVTGLPEGVREKNQDARLLSPAGLVDAYLKRKVTIQRTSGATGKVTTSEALITTGPNGVILQTGEGYEALRCTGLPERMIYGGVPQGLSAKPTLSVITQSQRAVSAKLTLTYLSAGFDWEANYIVQMRDEKSSKLGKNNQPKDKASLFAWLTLANGGSQSFARANTMAIAGNLNRERNNNPVRPTGQGLTLKCWPMQRTDQVPFRGLQKFPPMRPPPSPRSMSKLDGDTIVVTGARRERELQDVPLAITAINASMIAEQEDLGDLKLYRIPERVNVNAKGQKQVAMIVQPDALFERIYVGFTGRRPRGSEPMEILLRGKNQEKEGLGLPLPSGQVQVFENSSFGMLLAGETSLRDRAVEDKVEIEVGSSSDVRIEQLLVSESKRKRVWKITLTNAHNNNVDAEIELPRNAKGNSNNISKIDAIPTWRGIIPANDEIAFGYTVKLNR